MRNILCLALVAISVCAPHIAWAGYIYPAETHITGMVGMTASGPLDTPTLVTSYAGFTATFGSSTAGLANPWLAPSVAAYFTNGGQELYVVRVADDSEASFIGIDAGPGASTGLAALAHTGAVSMIAAPGNTSLAVQTAMILQCQSLRDRMAILDCAADADVASVQAHRAALADAEGYSAFYFPWIQAEPAGSSMLLPPSGFVAGLYSATEANDSPIGIVATATGVAIGIDASEQDTLNPLGINAIRDFGAQGVRVWGARTLATDPTWTYVATRRMQAFLEESIGAGTQAAIFEPNEPALWATLVTDVEQFLYERFAAGWLQGATPSEAYFVRCDYSTMTQADLDAGRTVILVGFAPVRPAEFLVFTVTHQRQVGTDAPVATPRSGIASVSPNPFNPRTLVRYEIDAPGHVELRAFDLQGRLVDVLVTGKSEPGRQSVWWDAPGLSSGVYLLQLRHERGVSTRKVTLVK